MKFFGIVEVAGRLHIAERPARRHGGMADEIGDRLRRLAFERRVSESSIVEVALQALYADRDDVALAEVLREGGATLRRSRVPA